MKYISTLTGKTVNLLSMSRLSAYTIASNCSDVTDLKDGLKEVEDFMELLETSGKSIPTMVYKRYNKLNEKLQKLQYN